MFLCSVSKVSGRRVGNAYPNFLSELPSSANGGRESKHETILGGWELSELSVETSMEERLPMERKSPSCMGCPALKPTSY